MYPQDRKLQQRIARRKVKVQRLIREQEARLAALEPSTFPNHQVYIRAISTVRKKLHRLKQELTALEAGKLSRVGV